jgi:carbamate kinase
MKFVIALGGNALISPGQSGSIEEQKQNADKALEDVVNLVAEGHDIVITHGNGFQVGNAMLRSEIARGSAYETPLHIADAHTQGEIGFIIQTSLQNKLRFWQAGIKRDAVTILTRVLVDETDPAFANPTKPVGRYYKFEEMQIYKRPSEVWIEDSGRGWRKVVPSPQPLKIVEKDIIKHIFKTGAIAIACGGGGIPVVCRNGLLYGIDAVIDKDLASAVLACELNVDYFVILTGVKQVALNFGRPSQVWLDKLTIKEAKNYLHAGHFPEGSMGPKIKAGINFLEGNPQGLVIITSLDSLYKAVYGKGGTRICIS